MKRLFITVLGLFGAASTAMVCAAGGMTELIYMDQEGDGGGFVTRYLVTERYLRLDFGRDREDYVLFDRQEKRVYNVSHEQQEVLLFEPGEVSVKPLQEWVIKEDITENKDSQKRVSIIVNGTVCTRLAATQGFLPEMAQALQEFQEVMAATHAGSYLATPENQRDHCDLARLVLSPQRWFKHGMPFDELRSNGFSRRLLNFQAGVAIRPKALEVPKHYRVIRFSEVQGKAP